MTILATSAIANSKVKTRWLEPYTSESLNRAFTTLPAGIHHGFIIEPNAGTVVDISLDPTAGDALALVHDATARLAYAVRETAAPSIDLAASAGSRAYILLYIEYATGVATSAEYRVVDLAELSNPWVDSAIMIGSVDVPGAGAVTAPDIEQASADIALGSGWHSMNDNPWFQYGGAGYEFLGTVGYCALDSVEEYNGVRCMRIGDVSGTGGSTTATMRVRLPPVKVGDVIFFRFKGKSSNVANGAILSVSVPAFYNETLVDANVASYQDYGAIVPINSDNSAQYLSLTADLSAGATATGYFYIDNLEVFIKRFAGDSTHVFGPDIIAAEIVTVGSGNTIPSGIAEAPTSGLLLFDENTGQAGVEFSDTGWTGLEDGAGSLLESAGAGFKSFKWFQHMFERFCAKNTGTVTKASATTVDVTEAIVYEGQQPAYGRLTVTAEAGLSTPGPNEKYVVYVDVSSTPVFGVVTETVYLATTLATNHVPLALVHVVASDIVEIRDLRDSPSQVETQEMPFTVGEYGRFRTIAGALKAWEYNAARLVDAGVNPTAPEIVIVSDISIDGALINGNTNLRMYDNLTIRALDGAVITVSDLGAAETLFNLDAKTNVTFKNLTFSFSGTMNATSQIFGDNTGAPGDVTFEDITCLEGASANLTAGDFLNLGSGFSGRMRFERCSIQTQTSCIAITGGSNTGTMLNLFDCKLAGGTASIGDGIPLNADLHDPVSTDPADWNTVRVRGCEFHAAAAKGATNFSTIDASRVVISDTVFETHGLLVGNGVTNIKMTMSNCQWNWENTSTAFPSIGGVTTCLKMVDHDYSVVKGCIVSANHATLQPAAVIQVEGSTRCIFSGLTINSRSGYLLRLNGTCSNNVVSDLMLESGLGGGTARGVQVDGNNNKISSIVSEGHDDDVTVHITGDNNFVTDMLVNQATAPGSSGVTDSGTGNTVDTGSIKVY